MNGQQEALVSLTKMRKYNTDYLTKEDHYIAGRIVKGEFDVVPYNVVFLGFRGPV